jgi:eukaryotic-like serine/threonine-protein kinase
MTVFSHYCSQCGRANRQQQSPYCIYCGSTFVEMSHSIEKYPQLLKQRYRIVDHVGQGGMGTVYKALDIDLGNRPVAVKELRQDNLDSQQLAEAARAFHHEAHLLAHLHHAHLPTIHEFFEEENRWYIVMSFIEGETLEHYLSTHEKGYLPVTEVLEIGIQLCTALEYLHMQQPPIIFRDLKPSNIMRTSIGHLYLIDFGIARHFKLGQMKDTNAFGSHGYAAPEQYGNARTSPQSDIYSLGVILHQLLTGDNPAKNTIAFHFLRLNRYEQTFPDELEELLQQMLAVQPAKRPEKVQVVKEQLSALIQGYATVPPTQLVAKISPSPILPFISPLPEIGSVLLTFNGHRDQVTALAWSPTINQIASGSRDKTIQLWDARTGNNMITYLGHAQAIASLSWSPNGAAIASGDFERIIRIWDATTGDDLLTYQGHNTLWSGGDAVRALAWSPDGTRIASVSGDSVVQIWSTVTQNQILTYQGHGKAFPVRCVAWSPDGAYIASAARYCDIWNAVTGELLYSDHSGQTHALAWSMDSSYLAVSMSDSALRENAVVKIIRVADGQECQCYKAHSLPAYALAWSYDGSALASASNTIHVWNPNSGQPIYVYHGHRGHISALAWSLDDMCIASGGVDGTVQVWQIGTKKTMQNYPSVWTS